MIEDKKKDAGIVIALPPEVAKLNKVDGFDPSTLLIPLTDEPGFTIPVSGKMTWFRLVYPDGRIRPEIIESTAGRSVVAAYLYADRRDPENEYIACNIGSCERNMENKFIMDRHLEVAASRAFARVLETAGFGCQYSSFNGLGDEGGGPSSTPMNRGGNSPRSNSSITQVEDKSDETIQQKSQETQGEPSSEHCSSHEPDTGDEPASIEGWKAILSFEDAKKVVTVHTSGANLGKTLGEIALTDPGTIEWIANKYSGRNTKAKAAAQILCKFSQEQAEGISAA